MTTRTYTLFPYTSLFRSQGWWRRDRLNPAGRTPDCHLGLDPKAHGFASRFSDPLIRFFQSDAFTPESGGSIIDAVQHGASIRPARPGDGEPILPTIGRAHVCTPVTNPHLVCCLLLEKNN